VQRQQLEQQQKQLEEVRKQIDNQAKATEGLFHQCSPLEVVSALLKFCRHEHYRNSSTSMYICSASAGEHCITSINEFL